MPEDGCRDMYPSDGPTSSAALRGARSGASSPAPRSMCTTRPRRRDRPTGCDTGWTDVGAGVGEKGHRDEGADAPAAGQRAGLE